MVSKLGGVTDEQSVPLILFVTDWCPACKHAEADLSKRSVEHLKVDIEKNKQAEIIFDQISTRTGSNAIPQILVGEQAFVGYSWPLVEQSLMKQKPKNF